MERLEKFAHAGMIYANKPSTNSVSFFTPANIKSGIEAGSVNIQSEITIEAGSYLCSNNHPIVVGDVNHSTGHLHEGTVRVGRDAWLGHLGDSENNMLLLGKGADGTVIVNGGKVLFEKGQIHGSEQHAAAIKVNEGLLSTRRITLPNPSSSIVLRHGLIQAGSIVGPFRLWIYGGIISVEDGIHTNTINLTGTGALIFGSSDKDLTAEDMGKSGINFVGNGGFLIVKIANPEGSLSKLYATETLFETLKEQGKIKRDGVPIENFKEFKMEKIIGRKGHSFAVLHPMPPGSSRFNFISEKIRRLLYGENPAEQIGY